MPCCACIDIGSNTTRLLVAQANGARLQELLSERAFTHLGVATADGCPVGPEKIDEVAAVVARQVRLAEELGVASLRVVATAAVRQAVDRSALAAAIEAACGARLEILTAFDEARLAFGGAIGMLLEAPAGPARRRRRRRRLDRARRRHGRRWGQLVGLPARRLGRRDPQGGGGGCGGAETHGVDEARLAFGGAIGMLLGRPRGCSASSTSAAARPSSSSARPPVGSAGRSPCRSARPS